MGGDPRQTEEARQPGRKCYFSRVPLPRTNEKRLVISREIALQLEFWPGGGKGPVNLTAATLPRLHGLSTLVVNAINGRESTEWTMITTATATATPSNSSRGRISSPT